AERVEAFGLARADARPAGLLNFEPHLRGQLDDDVVLELEDGIYRAVHLCVRERLSRNHVDQPRGDADARALALEAADDDEARVDVAGDGVERAAEPADGVSHAAAVDHAEVAERS